MKDYWNRSAPSDDQQFACFIDNPFFVTGILNGVFGLKLPPAPRNDLLGVFVPDITRIDLTIPPTPPASQNRLGPLAGDNAGWPFGGRRPIDDVVDIGFRALAGVLVPGYGAAPNNALGDGVNQNDVPLLDRFPFHAPACSMRTGSYEAHWIGWRDALFVFVIRASLLTTPGPNRPGAIRTTPISRSKSKNFSNNI